MTDLTFVTDVPASLTRGKRGRPEIFDETKRAAVAANPGQWAILQENVIGRSRTTALRKRYGAEGFNFQSAVTDHRERVNKDGVPVTDEVVTIYVQMVPAETTAPKAARKRTRGAAAAPAETPAETPAEG